MLIRLAAHFINNPSHIDKLICIKGLPDDWFFRKSKYGGVELLPPWKPDVDVNIPKEIRYLCDPMEITEVFSPIEKGRDPVVDKKTILGVRLDYMTEAGQTMWEKIERYLERVVARDQMVPKPVLVAANQKDAFSLHEARRTVRGSLELRAVDEVPIIDLTGITISDPVRTVTTSQPIIQPTVKVVPDTVKVEQKKEQVPCEECDQKFDRKNSLTMHKRFKHKKEPVPVA